MAANANPIQGDSKNILRLTIGAVCAGIPVTQIQAAVDEMIVTSTKREENLQEIPLAVTAFGDVEIVRQGFKTFSDYVGQIPSLSVVERQPGATNVLMRGCATQGLSFSDSATTSVYLDEQPITAAGFNPDPRLVDIERVEALGGPQGTLFGDAAQCGTLRIITNKPDAEEFGSWIDATGMTIDGGDTGYDLSGVVNIPLVKEKLALRLVGFVSEEPGWVDNVLSPSPGTVNGAPTYGQNFDNAAFVEKDVNTANTYGGRASLRWNVAEEWTVDLNAIYQKYELDGFADVDLNDASPNTISQYADTDVFPKLGEYDQIRFNNEDWEDEWYQLSLTAEGNLGFADLVVTGAYFNRENAYNADATNYLQAWDQDVVGYYFGGDPQAAAFDSRDTESYTFEARLTSAEDSESRWGWLAGVFYNHREVEELFTSNVRNLWDPDDIQSYYLTGNPSSSYYINYYFYQVNGFPSSAASNNWFTGTYDTELDQWAVFGEISFDITENFNVTAGGRWYDIQNDYIVEQGALIGINGRVMDCTVDTCWGLGPGITGEGDDDGFVPKLSATYAWDDGLVYATYSEGFRRGGANSARPGTIFGLPGGEPPPAGDYREYGSDEVTNYELGMKSEWFDNVLRFNITAYIMEWDDIQVQISDPITDAFALGTVNAPEAEIFGVETWVTWQPTESWSFNGTLGYNEGELSKDFIFEGLLLAADGTDLPMMPDWKASLNAEYTFGGQLFSATPFVLAQYVYWGDSTNSIGVESSEFVLPIKDQPSWQTLGLRAGLEGNTWSAVVYVDNVFDEYQETFYNNRWGQQRLSVGQPRTLCLGFRKYFGKGNPAK